MTEEINEEPKQSMECRAAIRAAVEKVGEYCSPGGTGAGGRHTTKFAGTTIEYPEEIYQIVIDETLEDDDRIKEIATSEWTIGQANEMCKSMFEGEGEVKQIANRVATRLAEKIVEQTRTEEET